MSKEQRQLLRCLVVSSVSCPLSGRATSRLATSSCYFGRALVRKAWCSARVSSTAKYAPYARELGNHNVQYVSLIFSAYAYMDGRIWKLRDT